MASAEATARGGGVKRDGAKGKGSGKRLADAFGEKRSDGAVLEWGDVDPRYMAWVVVAVTALGGAATFGRSRDGGALMVTLLLDGERVTTWINPRDVPEEILQQIGDKLEALR